MIGLETIVQWILKALAGRLPRWLDRRLASPEKITQQVRLELRRDTPIAFQLGAVVPSLRVYFEVTNSSLVDVTLERLLVELWVGQPILFGAVLDRYKVPKGSSHDNICFKAILDPRQVDYIKGQANGSLIGAAVTLYVHAYFESKVGLLTSGMITLERRNITCG